jgi:hypothetical protein
MRRAVFLILSIACVIAPGIANGAVTSVVDVQYLDDLKTCCASYTYASVRQFSSTVTGGGGEFVARAGSGGTNCGDATDEGVIIKETTGTVKRCWYRQFSGPVHLSWYGVADAADPTCYTGGFSSGCDSKTQLIAALGAAAVSAHRGGDGGVVTDGRSIYFDGNIDIGSDQYLSCNGPPGGSRDQSNLGSTNYYTLPSSLVVNPVHSIRRHANSRLSDCVIRPRWYYPQSNMPPTNVAETVLMMHQFSGTATTCDGESCNMDNMLIIGFDTCDETTKQRSILSNLLEECNVNEWIHDNGGGMKLQNAIVKQYIEGSPPTWRVSALVPKLATRGILHECELYLAFDLRRNSDNAFVQVM